ncbi:MAG: hypothetical protein HYZ13_07135 [Acidobacteria bacterium]|nr:hypothetical protein [Acidobacteriota bacterium]
MRLAVPVLLFALPLAAQSVDTRGLGRTWTDLGIPGSPQLRLDLDAGEVAIRPSEDGKVRVRYTGEEDRDLSRVRLRFEPTGRTPEFRLTNAPNDNFHIEIQVPRTTALTLRMSAGEVTIQGIEGDKDLRLQAGELKVKVGDPAAYGPVSASVWAGEVNPGPFGEAREGLFRTFRHQGQGQFSLQAKVKAGEVTFER